MGYLRSLSIVIPAYNEARRLPATLEAVRAYLDGRVFDFAEIVVVDDGSTDATAELVERSALLDARIRLLRNPGNRGKGYAVRHGLQKAQGEWVLFTDADLSTPIVDLQRLEQAVETGSAAGAIGSRALDRALVGKHQSLFRELSGRAFNLAMRLVTGLPYRDTQCGFKLLRADAARAVSTRQLIEGFGFDVEILFIARKLGFRVLEVPVRWFNAEGTKVSIWNGIAAFGDPIRVRLNYLRGRYR